MGIRTTPQSPIIDWPLDLTYETTYRIIVRYDQEENIAELWVDATDASEPSILGGDVENPGFSINTITLRQFGSTLNEAILVDNIVVGSTFAAVSNPIVLPEIGTYSGPGVTDNGDNTYDFDPIAAGIGQHTITYSFTNINDCLASVSGLVNVFAAPTASFTAPADRCVNDGILFNLGGGTPVGGVYSGSGVTDDGNGMTYSFDPAAADTGTITISYTYTENGCTDVATDELVVFGTPGPSSPPVVNGTQNSGDWEEILKAVSDDLSANDNFGASVAISENYAIVGAIGDENPLERSGAAYILSRSGNDWVQQTKLTPSDPAAQDEFGYSVAIFGDYAIVGTENKDNFTGAAYVFHRMGNSWTEQAKLTASDASSNANFGHSVSISGDYAMVGARGDDNFTGATYVFQRTGVSWTEQAKLTASDLAGGDQFGFALSIDGDYAVIGAPGNDAEGSNAGAAYVFILTGNSWTEQAKLTASDAAALDRFGESASISGNYVLIGAPWSNNSGFSSGSAYVFQRTGVNWTEQTELGGSDIVSNDRFGQAVAISGNFALIGGPRKNNGTGIMGAAYVFARDGASWSEQAKLEGSDSSTGDRFSSAVAMTGALAFVGSSGNSADAAGGGGTFFYQPILELAPISAQCSVDEPSPLPTAIDNCDGTVIGSADVSFPITSQGTTIVNWTFTDGANSTTVTQEIIILDTVAPTMSCNDLLLTLDEQGSLITITPDQVDGGSMDNCGIVSLTIDRTTFDCDDAGQTVEVTLTAVDATNNENSCIAMVSVQDTIQPSFVCPNDTTIVLNENCELFVPDFITGLDVFDNCSAVLSQSPLATSLVQNQNQGETQTVTITATDPSGNTSACEVTMTSEVAMQIASLAGEPITCQGITQTLTASGLQNLAQAENNFADFGIRFVYFDAPVADPYVGGTDLGVVAFADLDAGGTEANFAATFPMTPGEITVYAVLFPAPTATNCIPSQSLEIQLLSCGITNDDDSNPMIADPCVCKNNATTLENGQFDELVVVTDAPAGQSWTVTAVNGLFQSSSPALPAAPLAIPIGTALTEVPTATPGVSNYEITGIHVDGIGYDIMVSNGTVTLGISNRCWYPNPMFTNLANSYCRTSNPVTLMGSAQLGDGTGEATPELETFVVINLATGTTVVNDVEGNAVLDIANLPAGSYRVIYTFDAADADPDGTHPGCAQSIEQVFELLEVNCGTFPWGGGE